MFFWYLCLTHKIRLTLSSILLMSRGITRMGRTWGHSHLDLSHQKCITFGLDLYYFNSGKRTNGTPACSVARLMGMSAGKSYSFRPKKGLKGKSLENTRVTFSKMSEACFCPLHSVTVFYCKGSLMWNRCKQMSNSYCRERNECMCGHCFFTPTIDIQDTHGV